MKERLQKVMARAGAGSRRACEEFIRQGRVEVDGEIATLGQKADPSRQRIVFDGQPLTVPEPFTYIAVHKPRGVLAVSRDDRGRRTVRDLVPVKGHLYPVGRLDVTSEGLVLLTNDGAVANQFTHPRYGHTKEYQAYVVGRPSETTLEKWRRGVFLDGKRTAPADVTILRTERDFTWMRLVLREGRKRQIRRVAAMLRHPVRRLIRVRVGPIHLGALTAGEWRHLNEKELRDLKSGSRSSR